MIVCKKCGYKKDCFLDDVNNCLCPDCKDSFLTEMFSDEKKYFWVIGYRGEKIIKFYSNEQAKRYAKRTGKKIFPV